MTKNLMTTMSRRWRRRRGASWLSFARSSSVTEARQTARALRGDTAAHEKRFTGKTYDSVDSIAEFFRQRGDKFKGASRPPSTPEPRRRPCR